MKRAILTLIVFAVVATSASTRLNAQAVSTTVCAILASPQSFDGKIVQITGTVISGFDEFAIKDPGCKLPINAIWLAYPAGTKAKSGPAASILLQLAANSPGTPAPVTRTPVTLEKNKDFKQFDSLLAAQFKAPGRCLACARNTVKATLTGRIDGVANPGIDRDGKGMVTTVRGFGNLGAYPARLVVQSVAEVSPQELDYSKAGALPKAESEEGGGDPVSAAHQAAKSFSGNAIGQQIERAAAAYGVQGDDNGVELSFGASNELLKDDGVKGTGKSPDGLLYLTTLDMDRLKGKALSEAISHTGAHIADLRDTPPVTGLYTLESHAWQVTVFSAIANRERTLTLSGGSIVWSMDWVPADRDTQLTNSLAGYLSNWDALSR